MSQITFQNKVTLNPKPEVAEINKVTADNLNEIKDVVNSNATNTNNNFSDAYSTSTTYNVGDYCIYQDKLYRCITTVATAEVFDSDKWEQVNVANNLNRFYTYSLTAVSGNLAAGGWRNTYTAAVTDVLEPGTYIIVVTANLVGSGDNTGSARITIDDSELTGFQRGSIPLNSTVMSSNLTAVWRPTQKKSYSINVQVYGTIAFHVQYSSYLYLIKVA